MKARGPEQNLRIWGLAALLVGALLLITGYYVGSFQTTNRLARSVIAMEQKGYFFRQSQAAPNDPVSRLGVDQDEDSASQPSDGGEALLYAKGDSNDNFGRRLQGVSVETTTLGNEPIANSLKFPRSKQCGETCCVTTSLLLETAFDRAKMFTRTDMTPVEKIKYIKTHKTGSSTLGSIMFRYGARREHLTLYKSFSHGLKIHAPKTESTMPADIVVYHYAGIATNLKRIEQWEHAYDWYNEVVPQGEYVTIVRDPISHYLSYFYFYNEPGRGRPTLEEFVEKRNNRNILMRDFGVQTKEEMQKFMDVYIDKFKVILVSNRMSESLVIMAMELGWSLWDLTSVKLLDSAKDGFKRWDGKPVKKTPKSSSLDPELVKKIEDITKLDKIMYDYANAHLDKLKEKHGAARVSLAARALDNLNERLNDFCNCGDLGVEEYQMCKWYAQDDLKYEKSITSEGKAPSFQLPYLDWRVASGLISKPTPPPSEGA